MKEPRYTITLDNLTMNDVCQIRHAIDAYKTSKKLRARMAKLFEPIWDEYMKWRKANRKGAQHAS